MLILLICVLFLELNLERSHISTDTITGVFLVSCLSVLNEG